MHETENLGSGEEIPERKPRKTSSNRLRLVRGSEVTLFLTGGAVVSNCLHREASVPDNLSEVQVRTKMHPGNFGHPESG